MYVFVFFKQKTAYEMRISDWSSDVCSSDLASLGAFFYLVMDMLVHWGVLRGLREEIGARAWILWSALVADGVVLTAFALAKLETDPAVVAYAVAGIVAVFGAEWFYLRRNSALREMPATDRKSTRQNSSH